MVANMLKVFCVVNKGGHVPIHMYNTRISHFAFTADMYMHNFFAYLRNNRVGQARKTFEIKEVENLSVD